MTQSAEIIAVLVALLMLFVVIMRYVVSYTKNADSRRLEVFAMYEKTVVENATLKGQIEINKFKQAEVEKHVKFYQKELVKYRNLYEATLDKPTNKV